MGSRETEIGTAGNGQPVVLPGKIRSTHMHVIGASGRGKSKFLEHLIREDIVNKSGLCLIDPHGHLYEDVVEWCESKRLFGKRDIVLFDPGAEGWTFGFNPLDFGEASPNEISFSVDAMVKSCAQVWGGEDTSKTPLLKRCLKAIFHALAERRLTLLEADALISAADESGLRRYITRGLEDEIFRRQWDEFNAQPEREFRDQFSSTSNRLLEFLGAPVIRRIVGQQERVIDFRQAMDEGKIILVNLSTGGRLLSGDNARLLGSLLVNDLFQKAVGRPAGSRPFYVYIDECSLFMNEDIGRILDEARKFGLHLILSHQHLAQLKRAGESVYSSVMTNAQTKVVFGGLTPEDADLMARIAFAGEFNLEEAKRSLDKPVVVGYETVWMESESESEAEGSNWSSGQGESDGESRSLSQGKSEGKSAWDESGNSAEGGGSSGAMMTDSKSQSEASGSSRGQSFFSGKGGSSQSSSTRGRSQSLKPKMETLPGGLHTLEEQVYKAVSRLINQEPRQAVIKIPGRPSQAFQAANVAPGRVSPSRVARFKAQAFEGSGIASPVELADKELAARRRRLLAEAKNATRPTDPKKWRG